MRESTTAMSWPASLRTVQLRRGAMGLVGRKVRPSGGVGVATRKRRHVIGSLYLVILLLAAAGLTVFSVAHNAAGPIAKQPTLVAASLPFWNISGGTDSVMANQRAVNEVSPWMYGINFEGQITTQFPPEQAHGVQRNLSTLRTSGLPIVPTLANITDGAWAYEPVARMLHDPALMRKHVADIVALVKREGFSGIDIDYENLRAADRMPFTKFITDLGKALHAEGKTLAVAVFAKTSDAGYDERNVAQDYEAIGRAADEVRLMGYDYHWSTSPPGPVAPIGWVRDVLNYAKTVIPPERIVLGVPFNGYDWVDGYGTPVTWLQAFRSATEHRANVQYDTVSQTPWFSYIDGEGRTHEVWFENAASSKAKFEAARGAGIRGVYLWMFGYEDAGTWAELEHALPLDE